MSGHHVISSLQWRRLRAIALGIAAAAALASGSTAYASDEESWPNQNNIVVAQNYRDYSELDRTSLRVVFVDGDVTASNEAVAFASCQYCHTTAVAIEAVVVIGYPKTFVPQNIAMAINYQCSHCVTVADAWQVVLQYTGPVELTGQGEKQVAQLRQQLRDLADSNATPDAIVQGDMQIRDQLKQVLQSDLVPTEGGEDKSNEQDRESFRIAA